MPDPCATERTDAKSREHRPREINRQPVPAVRPKLACTHEPEPEHDERERRAVIQTRFSSQTEADRFGIVLVLDLHVRCKDGIGRREQRAQQHGRAPGQTESGDRERGDTSDGEQHRDGGEQDCRHASGDRIPAAAASDPP